jgi:acyl carrier protein
MSDRHTSHVPARCHAKSKSSFAAEYHGSPPGTPLAQASVMIEPTTQEVTPLGEDAIERRVLDIVVERTQVPIDRIARDSRIVPELTDSLGAVEIVMDLEDEFEGSIPDEAADEIQTVGQLIDHVKNHLASVKTGP